MSTSDMKATIQSLKKELWKDIPMSKESEKRYRQYIKMCELNKTSNIPKGGGKWDERFGLSQSGTSLRDIREDLERCAERDRLAGGKCGLLCQMRKRKK